MYPSFQRHLDLRAGAHGRVRVRDRRVGDARTLVAVEVAGDQPHERAAVRRGEQGEPVAGDRLIARRRHLQRGGQVHPQLHAVRATARSHEGLGGHLVVEDARPCGHPLRVALADDAAAAVRVVVRHDTVDHVGDGLEAAMRVPRRADGLVRRVVDWAELVEEEERVGDVGIDAAGEGSPHGEPGALDGVVSGRRRDRRDGGAPSASASRRRGRTRGLSTVTAGMPRRTSLTFQLFRRHYPRAGMHDHKHAVDWAAISDHMARRQALELPQLRELLRGSTCPREPPWPTSAAVPAAWSSCSPSRSARPGWSTRSTATRRCERRPRPSSSRAASTRGCGCCPATSSNKTCGRSWVASSTWCTRARSSTTSPTRSTGCAASRPRSRSGGRLVVVEGGLPTSHLPADCGVGRPGLEGRMRELQQQWFWSTFVRPTCRSLRVGPRGGTRSSSRPVSSTSRPGRSCSTCRLRCRCACAKAVRDHYVEWRERFGHLLDGEDNEALAVLVDENDPRGVLHRSDVFVLGARTAYVARKDR